MTKAQRRKEIIKDAVETCKQIDESPFIMKKMSFFWRLAGGKKSQAEYMKEKIILQAKLDLLDTI